MPLQSRAEATGRLLSRLPRKGIDQAPGSLNREDLSCLRACHIGQIFLKKSAYLFGEIIQGVAYIHL